MDQTQCYAELELALRRDDRKEARVYAQALTEWREAGGEAPDGKTWEECESLMAQALDPFGDRRDGVKE